MPIVFVSEMDAKLDDSLLKNDDGKEAELSVVNLRNESVPVSTLWKEKAVIIVFLRHFLCTDCQRKCVFSHSLQSPLLSCRASDLERIHREIRSHKRQDSVNGSWP